MAASSGYEKVVVVTGRDNDVSDDKLTSSEGDRLLDVEADGVRIRRRRCICTLFIILLAVAGAVGVGAYFVSEAVSGNPPKKSSLLFDDVFNSSFSPRSFSASWMPVSPKLVRLVVNDSYIAIATIHADSDQPLPERPFCVLPEVFVNLSVASFTLSPDERYLLVATNQSHVYRHSRLSQYAIVLVDPLDAYNSTLLGWLHGGVSVRYATWGRSSNALFFVTAGASQVMAVPDIHQLETTFNISELGVDGEIFYGIPDWLYEEEIFASDHAMWLSPDDQRVAYTSINEAGVKSFEWTVFGDPSDSYVTQTSIRYPKAGSPNPSVQLYVSPTSANSQPTLLSAPINLSQGDHYLMQVHWISATRLCGLWMDRLQQNATFAVYNVNLTAPSLDATWTLDVSSDTWVENYAMSSMSSALDGDAILVQMPRPDGKRFVHLALLRIPTSGNELGLEYLTAGDWEVTAIVYVDDTHVGFEASIQGPQLRQVYRVSSKQAGVVEPECVTCGIGDAQSCGYNRFSFSTDNAYILQQCIGPGVPLTLLARVLANSTVVVSAVLEANEKLIKDTENVYVPQPEFFTIDAGNISMPAMRLSPDDTKAKRPTLFYAYNGPLSQSVLATYPLSGTRGRWHAQLIGQYGFQVIIVDGRGTGLLGDVYGKAQYRRLGVVETEDQIAAARYAVANLNADAGKLAFWGWSYGGYMASMLASSGTGVYAATIAVAPVTDWRYYDTAYTERFMRLPTAADNLVNYDSTSVLNRVGMFNKTRFMLIHGTADDNVHFQNTAQFVRELVQQEVDFRLMFYTDKAHSLSGTQTQKHLYRNMGRFLRTALGV